MRFLLISHTIIGLAAAALCYFFVGYLPALSVFVGAAVMLGNLVVLGLVWRHILAKKLVALSVGVIVFKFAILIWIIYVVATSRQFHIGWFGGGIALVVLSALATAMRFRDR